MRCILKRIGLTVCSLSLLSACRTSTKPDTSAEDTVQSYLNALHNGNSREQLELRCVIKDASPDPDLLTNVQKWKIFSREKKADERNPNTQYVEVSARIDTLSMAGFSATKIWKFSVWNSNELFESLKRFDKKAQQLLIDASPDRSKITSKPYCIATIEKAGN